MHSAYNFTQDQVPIGEREKLKWLFELVWVSWIKGNYKFTFNLQSQYIAAQTLQIIPYQPTYFLYGKLLTHQDFLLAKTDVAYVVFLYLGQDIWLIDLSFHRKEDKRDFHNKRHWHFFPIFWQLYYSKGSSYSWNNFFLSFIAIYNL